MSVSPCLDVGDAGGGGDGSRGWTVGRSVASFMSLFNFNESG